MSHIMRFFVTKGIVVCIGLSVSGCLGARGTGPDATGTSMISGMSGAALSNEPARFKDAPQQMGPLYQKAALMAESQGDYVAAANHWGKVFDEDPSNTTAAKELAKNLRYLGAGIDSERVLREALAKLPEDKGMQLELAKTMVTNGNVKGAEAIIKEKFAGSTDVQVLQVHGIALDRQGRFSEAQTVYAKGLSGINPPAGLLNNAGLSYAMAGDLNKAEEMMRRAVVAKGATIQQKQNLALVLGLKGEIQEAEQISRANLPQNIAQETVRFYSEMVDQPAVWDRQS